MVWGSEGMRNKTEPWSTVGGPGCHLSERSCHLCDITAAWMTWLASVSLQDENFASAPSLPVPVFADEKCGTSENAFKKLR